MAGIEDTIANWFLQIAYNPALVYTTIVVLMIGSSFGLPVPEEVTLLSSGYLAYISLNPADFPPPPGKTGVNVHMTAFIAFWAVLLSDYFIYWLGTKFGYDIVRLRPFRKVLTPDRLAKVEVWVAKRGYWAAGVFRFTPGIRFPGHLTCGTMRTPLHKFLLVDGAAALISVPTQVYLVAFYGRTIVAKIKEFQIGFFILLGIFLPLYFLFRWWKKKKAAASA